MNPKPYRQLLPVCIFLVFNLVIYLYVMSVNSTSLNLIKPGPKDFSFLLIVGSYISTAIAMLLTLTSYFSFKAYMKHSSNETSQVTSPSLSLKDDKPKKIEDNKKSLFKNLFKREPKPVKEIKPGPNSVEKTVPQIKPNELKESKITPKEVVPQHDPNIKIVRPSWKKIEVKIPEEPTAKLPEKHENIAPIESKPIDSNQNKIDDKSIINIIEVAKEIQKITENKKENPIIETIHEKNVKIESIQPIEVIQKDNYSERESNIEEHDQEMLDSEVIKTLEELKVMVKDMKNSLKNK
jgi:hypothetical protein